MEESMRAEDLGRPEMAAPIALTIQIPLACEASRDACKRAIAAAEEAAETLRAQLAWLDFSDFMRLNPTVASVAFGGDWGSNAEGRFEFRLSADIEWTDGANLDRVRERELARAACDIFKRWGEDLVDRGFDRESALDAAGEFLLGDRCAAWLAAVERMRLDQAAQQGRAKSAEAGRL